MGTCLWMGIYYYLRDYNCISSLFMMTKRNSNKGRPKKRSPEDGKIKKCGICKKPRKFYSRNWAFEQHKRMKH